MKKRNTARFLFPIVVLLISLLCYSGCAGSKSHSFSSWSAFGNSNSQIFDKTWGLKY